LRLRLISLLAVFAALLVTSVSFASTQSSSVVVPIKITVTLKDYSFKFSRISVPKGSTVLFTVKNAGTQPHNVDFVGTGKRSAIIASGAKTAVKVVFKKKGTIQVVCDVPRHIQLGMVSTFKVK
jgi:plastocyanin